MVEFKSFKISLNTMPYEKQLVLALAFCERMYLGYKMFCQKYNIDPELRGVLDEAWDVALCEVRQGVLESCSVKADSVAPDTSDYSDILASSALDACVSLSHWFKFRANRILSDRDAIIDLGRDTLDMYIQELEDLPVSFDGLDYFIRSHRLFAQELKRQRYDIALSERLDAEALLDALRREYCEKDIGMIA